RERIRRLDEVRPVPDEPPDEPSLFSIKDKVEGEGACHRSFIVGIYSACQVAPLRNGNLDVGSHDFLDFGNVLFKTLSFVRLALVNMPTDKIKWQLSIHRSLSKFSNIIKVIGFANPPRTKRTIRCSRTADPNHNSRMLCLVGPRCLGNFGIEPYIRLETLAPK